jgi:hypothetical protein
MPIKSSQVNILNNPNKSFIQCNTIEPHKNQTIKAGTLFILSEINRPNKMSEKIIFIISQLLEKNYYLNDKIFLAEQLNSLKIEAIFESALVKSNRELLEFIDQQKISFNFKTLNIVVGLIYEDQVHFSSMGQNKSFLIKKNEENWQIIDINPNDEEHEIEELAAGKIFSSIISGELPENSYIVFSNPSLSQYLLSDEFIKIIGELKLEGATEQIKNYLKKINNYSNFCGLLIKNSSSYSPNNIKYHESDLTKTEQSTEKLLTTPGSIDKEKIRKKVNNFLGKINIFEYLFKTIKNIFKKIKIKKEKNIEIAEHSQVEKKWKNKKILLIIIGILLLILIINVIFQKKENNEVLTEESASSFEELIEQKQNQIESALLYNNEARAKEIIDELREIIESLSDKEKNKIKNYNELEEKLNEQTAKINKIITVENPEELGNFNTIEPQANAQAGSLFQSTNKIYVIDGSTNSIYSLNLENKILNKITKNDSITNTGISINEKNNKIYFLTENQIISIDDQEKIIFNKIKTDNYSQISSFDVYNNMPYLLNKDEKQIYRYEQMPKDDLNSFTKWIKDDSDINPIYLITDYNIYLLEKDGTIYEYKKGSQEQKFSTGNIEPKINNATLMRFGNKYLYILDKEGKRFIVYSYQKDAKDENKMKGIDFINQYYSEKFDDLKDLMIDENKNKVYILNGNIVYSVDLSF